MEPTATPYQLSPLGRKWASKRRQNVSPTKLKEMLNQQGERCALSGAPLLFDKEEGTPHKGGKGVHPLYPAVDHIECDNVERGCQVVCFALNDVKGHLPFDCFEVLKRIAEWRDFMERWREQAEKNPHDRQAFRRLIFPNDSRKK